MNCELDYELTKMIALRQYRDGQTHTRRALYGTPVVKVFIWYTGNVGFVSAYLPPGDTAQVADPSRESIVQRIPPKGDHEECEDILWRLELINGDIPSRRVESRRSSTLRLGCRA